MLPIPRRFLFIFLTLLQVIAPLVHAHTNHSFANSGLHVPGLESYGVSQFSVLRPTVSNYGDDGMLIMVDTGFRQNQASSMDDANDCFTLPLQPRIVKSTLSTFDANFSPHFPLFFTRLNLSLQAPRAPPLAI